MKQIVEKYLRLNIPRSIHLDGIVYDSQKISDAYIDGTLIMRSKSCKISHGKNYFLDMETNSRADADFISVWGLFVVQHMIDCMESSGNEKYLLFIKDIVSKFLETVCRNKAVLQQTMDAAFIRVMVLIRLYLFLKSRKDPCAESIYTFLVQEQLCALCSTTRRNGQIYCAKMLLYWLSENRNGLNGAIEEMNRYTDDYICPDGSSADQRLASNTYFGRFFSLFMDLLEQCGIQAEPEISRKYQNQTVYLRTMTGQEGYFPAINGLGSVKSPYSSLDETRYFPDAKILAIKDRDVALIQQLGTNKEDSRGMESLYLSYGGSSVFLTGAKINGHMVYTGPCFVMEKGEDTLRDSRAVVSEDRLAVTVDTVSGSGRMQTEYQYVEIQRRIQIRWNIASTAAAAKYYLVLAPHCRDAKLTGRVIDFYAGGFVPARISVQGDHPFSVSLISGEGDENGCRQPVQIVEIASVEPTADISVEICFDYDRLVEYNGQRPAFLPQRAREQVKTAIESDVVSKLIQYGNIGATEIYRVGRQAYLERNFELAKRCEILNSILHNCIVKSTCDIRRGSRFAYGGVGVLVHAKCVVGEYCMIGVGAALANAVTLGNHVYVSPGVRFVKKIHVGDFSIIGANAAVNRNVEPFSVVAGIPGKVISRITPENLDKYLVPYFCAVDKENADFIKATRERFLTQYEANIREKLSD